MRHRVFCPMYTPCITVRVFCPMHAPHLPITQTFRHPQDRKRDPSMAKRQGTSPRRASGSLGRLGEVPEMVEPDVNDSDNDNNNVFSSGSTTTQKSVAASRLPSIKERRPSIQKKARSSSSNDSEYADLPNGWMNGWVDR